MIREYPSIPCFSASSVGHQNAKEMLEGLIARSEQKMNETILSAQATELSESAKESLKREIMEEVAKNFTCTKDENKDLFSADIGMKNATDKKQIAELRTNVLTNTQREFQTLSLGWL